MSFRKIVRPTDLNAADCLFGGQMMKWLDEAAAIFATCKLETKSLVTLKVSECRFFSPAFNGDIIEFFCSVKKFGKTSLTVKVEANTKTIGSSNPEHIVTATVVFVTVDCNGRPERHGKNA